MTDAHVRVTQCLQYERYSPRDVDLELDLLHLVINPQPDSSGHRSRHHRPFHLYLDHQINSDSRTWHNLVNNCIMGGLCELSR